MTLEDYFYYRSKVAEFDPDALRKSAERTPPTDALEFARRAVIVIVNSSLKATVAVGIFERLWPVLCEGGDATAVFGHAAKAVAINELMNRREELFAAFENVWPLGGEAVITFCEAEVPFIGPVTKFHLAKLLGIDCAKPDIWLERVAAAAGEGVHGLCTRLARESGDKVATVDSVIWRACERGWWPRIVFPPDA
jgi:hypothetical protein